MKIAVIDVAAEEGGALSVLKDFVNKLMDIETENEWYIITGKVSVIEKKNIINLKYPEAKKSWIHRILWEKITFKKLMKKLKIDVVFSLQNNALPKGEYKQVVYLHNVLLLQPLGTFVNFKKYDVTNAIYANILGPYIRNTWKNADKIIVQTQYMRQLVNKYNHQMPVEAIMPTIPDIKEKVISESYIKGYIYPGSIYSYKNYEAIIDAVKALNKKGEKIEVLLTITGNENGYTRNIYKMSQGLSNVKFIGRISREELIERYKEYGLLMVSKMESFGVPLVEAMMVGTVIVGLDYPYIKEVAKGYNRLYLVNDERLPKAMKDGICDNKIANYSYDSGGGYETIIRKVESI